MENAIETGTYSFPSEIDINVLLIDGANYIGKNARLTLWRERFEKLTGVKPDSRDFTVIHGGGCSKPIWVPTVVLESVSVGKVR